jgi:hypothetical protein
MDFVARQPIFATREMPYCIGTSHSSAQGIGVQSKVALEYLLLFKQDIDAFEAGKADERQEICFNARGASA